jgi:hypothetical protein
MLQPHSFLWHYLWVGPGILLAVLAVLAWRRGYANRSPAFFIYLVFESIQALTLYAMDLTPRVSANAYWHAGIASLVVESLIKLAVLWELFSHLVKRRLELAGRGKVVICRIGAALVMLAAVVASQAHLGKFLILSYFQILEQGIYLVEAGLLLFLFLFAGHFRLAWDRRDFGVALGLSISACVGLGVFAVYANGILFTRLYLLDFLLTPRWSMIPPARDRVVEDKHADSARLPIRRLWPT